MKSVLSCVPYHHMGYEKCTIMCALSPRDMKSVLSCVPYHHMGYEKCTIMCALSPWDMKSTILSCMKRHSDGFHYSTS